jgi:hypothetical protein
MILLFPSKGKLVEGQSLPLIQIPLSSLEGGQSVELNDFQWWAKTSTWQSWLKKNPRSWKAESESTEEYLEDLDLYPHLAEIKRLKTFEEFSYDFEQMFEADDEEGDPEKASSLIKYLKTKESLKRNNKIDYEIEFENIQPGEPNAWFLSPLNPDGTDAPEMEMAYKITKKFTSGGQFSIYQLDEIQPLGQKTDDSTTFSEIYEKATDFFSKGFAIAGLALSGFLAIKAVGGLYSLFTLRSRVRRFRGRANASKNLKSIKSFFQRGGKWAFKGLRNTANLFRGVISGFGKGYKWARQGYSFSRNAGKARSLALKNSFKSFGRGFLKGVSKLAPKTAAEAIPVVGWILAIGDVAQQTYNWFSSNQAPRFGEVEKIASDVFEPGKIPAGDIITICWTQEGSASSGWTGFLPFTSDDTRTTMDLAKVGDFGSSSLFILLNIGSKGLSQEFMSNDITFIVFDKGAKFEHGLLDNDDLEFKVIGIDNVSENSEAMSFHGICPWPTFMESFDSQDPNLVKIDPSAPSDLKFNFQSGGTRVNVTGTLVGKDFVDLTNSESGINKMIEKGIESEDAETEEKSAAPTEDSNKAETSTVEAPEKVEPNEGILMNFSDFVMISEKMNQLNEAEDSLDDIDFTPEKVAIFKTTMIENADENAVTAAPKFKYFIVDTDSDVWNSEDGSPIDVASDEYDLEDTRKGHAPRIPKVESEWVLIGSEDKETSEAPTFTQEPEEESAQSYFEVEDEDVKIKIKNDIQKMKDTSVGGFNLLKELTTEDERKLLGIDDWEELDVIKVKGDPMNDVDREVKLREKGLFGGIIPNGRKKTFTPKDGELFYTALSVFNRMKNKVKVK